MKNMSLRPRARDSRSAVSALIPLFPWTISVMRRAGTSIAFAIRYCEMPIGSRNSVSRISPGWVDAKSAIGFSFLVVVDEFDVAGPSGASREAEPPLIVNADAVLAGAAADKLLKTQIRRPRNPSETAPELIFLLSG